MCYIRIISTNCDSREKEWKQKVVQDNLSGILHLNNNRLKDKRERNKKKALHISSRKRFIILFTDEKYNITTLIFDELILF